MPSPSYNHSSEPLYQTELHYLVQDGVPTKKLRRGVRPAAAARGGIRRRVQNSPADIRRSYDSAPIFMSRCPAHLRGSIQPVCIYFVPIYLYLPSLLNNT